MSQTGLRIVCALYPEAKPIIHRLGMHMVGSARPFKVYRDVSGERWLVVSGVGKVAAAAAVAHLAATSEAAPAHAWLNVGICGHDRGPVGEVLRVHKLKDEGSGRLWYPSFLDRVDCDSDDLRTVDMPDTKYTHPGMVDMEASGFYESALRYTSQELIQMLKVVSDCPESPIVGFRASEVTERIQGGLPVMEQLMESLATLSRAEQLRLADPPGLNAFQERWRFTESQRIKLRKLLLSWNALIDEPALPNDFEAASSSRELIVALSERVESAPLSWGKP